MLSANLQPGDSYATEDELTRRFGVSRNTVRKAMAELESAGFIVRRQRVGAIAAPKACTGRIVEPEPRVPAAVPVMQSLKAILVLPQWEANAGNYFSNIVLHELSNVKNGQQRITVEIRLFDDPLNDLAEDVKAIIIVDAIPQMIPPLAMWSRKGVKIIAIETRSPLYMALNIKHNIYRAAYEAVQLLHRQGHQQIGLINQDISHDTFQQWLRGYLSAHRDLKLAISPHAIVQVENRHRTPEVEPDGISAWICTYKGAVDMIAQACYKKGLRIPQDVAIIGADDPGDLIMPSLGCKLTVVRPDYITLSKTIREILEEKISAEPGSVIESPMKWIYRDSAGKIPQQ
jgi:DNA-binding LacI/PurR family transcriptional regulator